MSLHRLNVCCSVRNFLAWILFINVVSALSDAQTFRLLHTFTGGQDGAISWSTLNIDQAGTLYGTTQMGGGGPCFSQGTSGCGTIFQLKNHSGSWIYLPLYMFQGGADGAYPYSGMIIGANGTFYGTTSAGGDFCSSPGCGTAYNAGPTPTRPLTPLPKFRERTIHEFGGTDADPMGDLVFDSHGNLYGTTSGPGGCIFELTPSGDGIWDYTIIYSFMGGNDGSTPFAGLAVDSAGNLYGTTYWGGGSSACSGGCGTVFELSPSGSGWTERVIYSFQGDTDGKHAWGGVTVDAAGNLYGISFAGGVSGGGTIYELSPSGSNWDFQVIYNIPTSGHTTDRPTFDSAGNLYATIQTGGAFFSGQVLKLTPSNGQWVYTDLYDFSGGSDGSNPLGAVAIDSSGNLYGTTSAGGASGCGGFGCGTVWEIAHE